MPIIRGHPLEGMVRLASAGIFCLHHPDHPTTQEMPTIAARVVPENQRRIESLQLDNDPIRQ